MLTKLKHLSQSGTFPSGNPRFYYRPKGQKAIAMPDRPRDHPEFLAAYAKAAGVTPRALVTEGSLGAALILYKASDAFALLAPTTKAQRRPILDHLVENYGHANRAGLQRRHIEADVDKFSGSVRNNRLKVWRGFAAWMKGHYKLAADPSEGLRKTKTAASDGHVPWTVEDVVKFRAHWQHGTMPRLAFELIHWTGARVSDAIRLGRGNITADGWLSFKQQKTGGVVDVPFNRALPDFAAEFAGDLAELRRAIDARNEKHMTFLHTAKGASRSPKSVSQWFAAKAREAGLTNRTAHGLRKTRAETLFACGATMGQAQAWTGHEDPRMLMHYAKKYDRRRALSQTNGEQKVPTRAVQFQIGGK